MCCCCDFFFFFNKLNSAIYSALEVSHSALLGSVSEEDCVGCRMTRNTCFKRCCLKLCVCVCVTVMPFQTFINSAVAHSFVGWRESLSGTAQRTEFMDVWLTRPPLWHNWRGNFPSHGGVGKLGCVPGSPCSSAGTGGLVKQFLHWECQALSVKIPGGCIRKVGFYRQTVSSHLAEETWAEMFPPVGAEPGLLLFAGEHSLKCLLFPFVLPLWSVRGAVTSSRLHVLCTVGIFIARFQIYCDDCFTTMGVQ